MSRWNFSWLPGILIAVMTVISFGEARDQSPGITPEQFNALDEHQKQDFVLKALDSRDAALQNIDFAVTEKLTNHAKDGSGDRFMDKEEYEVRRLGEKFWMKFTSFEFYSDNNTIREQYLSGWDGSVSRRLAIPPYSGRPVPTGQIMPNEITSFRNAKYLSLLGFKMNVSMKSTSIAGWLRDAIATSAAVHADMAEIDKRYLLHVHVAQGDWNRDLTLDATRGFMIVHIRQDLGMGQMTSLLDVTDTQEIGGVWIPKKAVGTGTTYADREVTETDYDLQNFAIGSNSDSDVMIDFPAGTRVIDAVQKIDYDILPDGKFELHPLADSRAKTVRLPPENNVVSTTDHKTAASYTTVPLLNVGIVGPTTQPSTPLTTQPATQGL
jgi:hypothetical protein